VSSVDLMWKGVEHETTRKAGRTPAKNKSGTLVGQHAAPISETNLGNKLLKSMGWTGGGLGASGQGIAQPITATIKNNKCGLGFDQRGPF